METPKSGEGEEELSHDKDELEQDETTTAAAAMEQSVSGENDEGSREDVKISPVERASRPAAVAVGGDNANYEGAGGVNQTGEAQQETIEQDEESSTSRLDNVANRSQDEKKSQTFVGNASEPGAVAVAGTGEGDTSSRDTQIANHDDEEARPSTAITASVARAPNEEPHADVQEMIPSSKVASETKVAKREYGYDDVEQGGETTPPMVQAELVAPLVEALRVSIDEDYTISPASPQFAPFEMEQARHAADSGHRKNYSPVFWVLLTLLLIVIICAVAVPLVLLRDDGADTVEPTISMTPTYPYPCYTSTWDILDAQLSEEETPEAYIMCPNTSFQIGTFTNPESDDYRFRNGDHPLMVVRPNVTIQCGLDGRRENNCVLDGGFMHVLILQQVPLKNGSSFFFNNTIDNMLIRGVTFTGNPDNVGPFSGLSVGLSHPGRNLRFEDCLWSDLATSSGLIGVYRNSFQRLTGLPLEDQSIEVTFSDCIFQNIVYDKPLIYIIGHTLRLERCIFRDVNVSVLAADTCVAEFNSGVMPFYEGCASLLACSPESSCVMENVCVQNFDFKGPGLLFMNDLTEFYYSGLYLDAPKPLEACELAVIYNLDTTNTTCSDIFTEQTCPVQLPYE